MINMMYLVLTALLALNVSKEILDAFVTVNNGLETTKLTLKEKMDATYKTFSQYASENAAKYGDAFASAQQIQNSANALVVYIDSIKVKVISGTEKIPVETVIGKDDQGRDTIMNLMLVNKKDAYDDVTNLMVGSEPAKPKEGPFTAADLRQRLEAFREQIKAVVGDKNPTLVANVDRMFNYPRAKEGGETGVTTSWESINFYHVPLAAVVTILSKLQGDVRNAENEVVNWMLGSVEQKTFKFNTLTAIVKPQSSYVTVGSTYKADIFLGAYDNQNAPEVYICGPGAKVDTSSGIPKIVGESIKLPMEGAMAKLEQGASGAGLKTVSGIIKFKPVGGEEQIQAFETTYEVAAPNLVVSPTKMNVFYRGVDNPVDVSVAGYSAKDIVPNMSNGTISKDSQGYIVRPGSDNKAMISVTVSNPDGSKKSLPGVEFRVKNVPNPTPYFAGKSVNDENIKKAELEAAQYVIAKMENFEFDLKFEVVEVKVTMIVSGTPIEKTVKSGKLSDEMKEMLKKAKPGQKIYIEGIKAKGPDDTIRNLGALTFKVV